MSIHSFLAAACLIAAATIAPGANAEEAPSASDLNGLWNESAGNVGFWIGKEGQSCAKGFHMEMPFLFVALPPEAGKKQQGELAVKALKTCALFETQKIARCSDGSFSYTLQSANSQYTGVYDVLLNDGRRVSGKFKVGFCKAAK